MDSAQWPQGIGVVQQSIEGTKPLVEKKPRPQKEQALNCPRCNSTNTKFCYYNNYSLSQPRYFCKTCRRYWTEGGSLRNVPVGGSSRKNKRSISTSTSSLPAAAPKKIPDLTPQSFPQSASSHQNPKINVDGQDLNLAYPPLSAAYGGSCISEFVELHFNENKSLQQNPNSSSHIPSAMELLKPGIASRGLSAFMSMPLSDSNTMYSAGFPLQDFKPSFKFPLDGFENAGYGNLQDVQGTGPRLFFPFEDLKSVSSTSTEFEQTRGQGESNEQWNGMLGGRTW